MIFPWPEWSKDFFHLSKKKSQSLTLFALTIILSLHLSEQKKLPVNWHERGIITDIIDKRAKLFEKVEPFGKKKRVFKRGSAVADLNAIEKRGGNNRCHKERSQLNSVFFKC